MWRHSLEPRVLWRPGSEPLQGLPNFSRCIFRIYLRISLHDESPACETTNGHVERVESSARTLMKDAGEWGSSFIPRALKLPRGTSGISSLGQTVASSMNSRHEYGPLLDAYLANLSRPTSSHAVARPAGGVRPPTGRTIWLAGGLKPVRTVVQVGHGVFR